MCDYGSIYGQVKAMAGADYGAIADNVTREIMVIAIESPEARQTIKDMKDTAECLGKVAAANDIDVSELTAMVKSGDWTMSSDALDLDQAKQIAEQAKFCTENINKWEIGKISGRLFASFFAQELMPEVAV